MNSLKVWSPFSKNVSIKKANHKIEMFPIDDGYWILKNENMDHNDDYAFYLDESGPYPDPCSRWQPNGVNGNSRWVDHSLFQWHDQLWVTPPLSKSTLMYELHVGTFTNDGTFATLAERLDYFVDLKIDIIELMPVNSFSGNRGWGYDGVNLYAVFDPYGGPEELKKFIDLAHQKGIAVILDVVYNHLGSEGNFLGKFGPYFTEKHKTPWGPAINYDGPECKHVRKFFIDNALMWLSDYHFDGLRIDAVHAIIDHSVTHFLKELSLAVKELEIKNKREFYLIAESNLNDPQIIYPYEKDGYGLDAQWSDDFHHTIHTLLTKEQGGYYVDFGKISQLKKVLQKGFAYTGDYSVFHQKNHGRPSSINEGRKFVSFIQNHDQVGNRARGERLNHLVSYDKFKIAALINLMSPFMPILFQGEEWAATTPFLFFCNHQDPEIVRATREGRQKEFSLSHESQTIPDPEAEETFQKSKLNWDEVSQAEHQKILTWYRQLICIRKNHLSKTPDDLRKTIVNIEEEKNIMTLSYESLTVIINFSQIKQDVKFNDTHEIILESSLDVKRFEDKIILPAFSAIITKTINS